MKKITSKVVLYVGVAIIGFVATNLLVRGYYYLNRVEEIQTLLPDGRYVSADDHGRWQIPDKGVALPYGWYVEKEEDDGSVYFRPEIPQIVPRERAHDFVLIVRDGGRIMEWVLKDKP